MGTERHEARDDGDHTLLLGAAYFRLTAEDAEWLETRIRDALGNVKRGTFPVDESVWGCILLADVLREDLDRGSSPEPIELGRHHVEGLLTFVLREDDAAERSGEVAALYEALLRFRGDPA